ncbi:protein possibly involved in post-translational modification of quorum-sensing peptides [Schinkia azotoformans MEV2011]|uniref:Protein possibly involved in post-translational modification of quorum-sensing peptides n=1 Tax=Schinkia azotoformans MEV2011 TaxID=1348973 RepID=A0A072NIY0_SCHAZ|nr:accessory gene regulator B family protein [Schinkia azotoformans]KEF36868.1 protein possibly involved in post-translational modification of quorum-sensing peptides [Schinkia azotoformans MEV2011]MEC1723700.1 accessory gene regulator B family protein [Schinkia azotoformans]MEC1778483.1 accessory gene regulator B family protein [Schinkia azotoformans]MED4328241.1 accessory gene regulator B family protein [Schinkia azotoformans]MED4368553.1 accessory gene regulator B family protein [Schinkia a
MITRISQLFARKLAIVSGYVEEEDFLRYGFELLIGYFIKVLLLLTIAVSLHITLQTIFLVLAFVSLRIFSGGHHLSTYLSCMIFSLGLFILLAVVATNPPQILINHLLITLHVAIILGMVSISCLPKENNNNPIIKSKKGIPYFVLTIWYFILLVGYLFDMEPTLILSSLFGLMLQYTSLTPIGVKIIEKVNQLLVERSLIKNA